MIAVGACGSREFTVLGNVVNVAFRLNSVGNECGKDLLTGEATAKHLEGYFELEKLGLRAVKGRSEKVTVDTLA